jgi:anti-sigma factor RsiW
MITCRELAHFLIDFVAGELPEQHRDLVEKHLFLCPPCVTYLETYKITIQLTRQLPTEPIPERLRERLTACLREMEGEAGHESL